MNRLDDFTQVACDMLAAARPILRHHFRTRIAVEHKPDNSPVTLADRAAEQAMKAVLARQVPEHGVLGEEYGSAGLDARYIWVLDPIDGTRSFISGVPLFGTLIALLDNGVPVLSLIDMPALEETWVGRCDRQTAFNHAPCTTSGQSQLGDSMLFATSPDQFSAQEQPQFAALAAACRARRFGGDCYSYGLLASGHIDLIIEAGLQPYDYLPLVPIITGAGGCITDWHGASLNRQSCGQVLASASPALHKAALHRIAEGSWCDGFAMQEG